VTTLKARIETSLPVDDAFALVADFASSAHWDPGVAFAERIDAGPLGVGAQYRLGIRMGGRVAPMDYHVTVFEPLRRVVLVGTGTGVEAEDEILFEATPTGTRIDYTADIRLRGLLRLATPFVGGVLARIGRDARDGMQRALDRRAAAA
jgi:hypothetical protein